MARTANTLFLNLLDNQDATIEQFQFFKGFSEEKCLDLSKTKLSNIKHDMLIRTPFVAVQKKKPILG